jgi:hypothetical protein
MAGSKTGTPSIIRLARKVCRLVNIYGASDLEARTSPAFKAAVVALVAACAAFELADDWPGEVDNTPPAGPEDTP